MLDAKSVQNCLVWEQLSFKLGESNLPPSILTWRFTDFVKFDFEKGYLPLDSHANTVISDCFAYP